MDLALSDEQRELVGSFANLLSKASTPERVRAAEPAGFDPALWQTLVETGVVEMAVPEAAGGWGASLLDLALVDEQVGRAAAAAPVIEGQVAARLLAAVGHSTDEHGIVTLAVHPSRGGVAALTPAGAICDAVIVLDRDRLRLVRVDDAARRSVTNLGSAPLADIQVSDAGEELASGTRALDAFEHAIDEWLTLTASAVVGMAAVANEIGCAYAAERKAFGAVIGTFQGVAHPLADDATNIDGAQLLVRKAAWALDRGDTRRRELAAMAFGFAVQTAEAATYNALHVHGGYGFMLEYDVQLYYRRARGWSRVWGDAGAAFARAATARYGAGGA